MNSTSTTAKKGGKWTSFFVYTVVILLAGGLIVGQLGINPFASMLALSFAHLFAIIAGLIVVIGALRSRSTAGITTIGWAALVLGALAFLSTGSRFGGGGGGAPIHDISTDTQNPPEFIAIAPLRADAPNPSEYLDDGTAEVQAEAYPDIQTIVITDSADTVFLKALSAAEAMGWEIVASVPSEGRIEATAATPYVGFKDDVVVRVTAADGGTKVDVRSKSRMGKGDMGVNAARIRAYSAKLTSG